MAGSKGSTHYSATIKLQAVEMYLEQGRTYAAIAAALGIRHAKRIEAWVHDYRREGELAFHRPKGRPRKKHTSESELERLRMENALLKKFHSELRKLELAQRNIG